MVARKHRTVKQEREWDRRDVAPEEPGAHNRAERIVRRQGLAVLVQPKPRQQFKQHEFGIYGKQ